MDKVAGYMCDCEYACMLAIRICILDCMIVNHMCMAIMHVMVVVFCC